MRAVHQTEDEALHDAAVAQWQTRYPQDFRQPKGKKRIAHALAWAKQVPAKASNEDTATPPAVQLTLGDVDGI